MAYRNEMREAEGKTDGEQSYDFVLMTIVNVYSKDLFIYPTHRLVGNLSAETISTLIPKLENLFQVETVGKSDITRAMEERGGKAIGLYAGDSAYMLTLKADPVALIGKPKAKPPDRSYRINRISPALRTRAGIASDKPSLPLNP
jgi:hypothetical protein